MERDYEKFPDDDNGDVLWQFRTQGDSLTEPREIDFSVMFPTEDSALEFAVTCLRSEFKVEFGKEEGQEDGLDWVVTVYTHGIPTHSEITQIEQALGEQAATLGGRNSGWSAIFVPAS